MFADAFIIEDGQGNVVGDSVNGVNIKPLDPLGDLNLDTCGIDMQNQQLFIQKILISLVVALMGLEHSFLGYKQFRQTMFLSGALFATAVTILITNGKVWLAGQVVTLQMAMCIGLAVGMLFGLLTSMIDYLGLFLTGFYLGVIATVQVIFGYLYFRNNLTNPLVTTTSISSTLPDSQNMEKFKADDMFLGPVLMFLLLFSVGSTCSVLTLFFPKVFVIISTAQTGAVAVLLAISYLVEDLAVITRMISPTILKNERRDNVCPYTIFIWGASVLLSFIGILFQFMISAKNYDHRFGWFNHEIVTNTLGRRKRRRTPSQSRRTQGTRSSSGSRNRSGRGGGQAHSRDIVTSSDEAVNIVQAIEQSEREQIREVIRDQVREPVRRSATDRSHDRPAERKNVHRSRSDRNSPFTNEETRQAGDALVIRPSAPVGPMPAPRINVGSDEPNNNNKINFKISTEQLPTYDDVLKKTAYDY